MTFQRHSHRRGPAFVIPVLLALAGPAFAQTAAPAAPRGWGHVSFYATVSRLSGEGTRTTSEFVTAVQYQIADGEGNGIEYGIDTRRSSSTAPGRDPRLSIYDGYVGARLAGGHLRVRGGQMWITDLGGLGSVSGGLVEYRMGQSGSRFGRLRLAGFGGVEPAPYDLGMVDGIRKFGGYATVEGRGARRHTVGFVESQHGRVTERSVLTTSNFVPIGTRVFLYQAAEFDLAGPAGQGRGGLSYFFTNARVALSDRVDLQALYHRGRAIDFRAITDDVLNGRPIPATELDGLLYSSTGARINVQVVRTVRVNAGYTRDRNNRDSEPTGRATAGASVTNLGHLGLDLTISESIVHRPGGRYQAEYLSIGRQIGRTAYVSADYSTSLSIARFTRSDGITVDLRPRTRQVSGSLVVGVARHLSVLVNVDRTSDDTRLVDVRMMSGLTYRFR